MLEKLCSYHKVLHPIAEFGKLARSPDGLQPICKAKRQEIMREYRKRTGYKPNRTPEQRMAHNLMKNYKITLAQYNEMLMSQCGICAVCGNLETNIDTRTKEPRRLAVHHNHITGKVLSLCCSECNMRMGKLKDSYTLLIRAAELMKEEGE